MRKVVVSLGGSLLFFDGNRNGEYIGRIAALFRKLAAKVKLVVVVGGGRIAREYAEKARKAGNEFLADEAAIKGTWENAEIVRKAIGGKASRVVKSVSEAAEELNKNKIVVSGGMFEGLTTDSIAALIAERVDADALVNLSTVDGIYSKNPKEKGAKKLRRMKHEQLLKLAIESDMRKAGTNFVFDSVAAKLAARSRLHLIFVDGRNLKDAESAILGKKHNGTAVS